MGIRLALLVVFLISLSTVYAECNATLTYGTQYATVGPQSGQVSRYIIGEDSSCPRIPNLDQNHKVFLATSAWSFLPPDEICGKAVNYTIDGVPYDGQVAGFVNLTPTPESGSYEECAAIILPSPYGTGQSKVVSWQFTPESAC